MDINHIQEVIDSFNFPPFSPTLGTRKKVIYSCTERSQEKSWWRFVAVLTCKSFVWCGY